MRATCAESYSTTDWQRDLEAVGRGTLSFEELYRRHGGYVAHLARSSLRVYSPYMSHDDYRQEIWAIVHKAVREYNPDHPKRVPMSGWVGWRIRKRLQRIAEKMARTAAAAQGGCHTSRGNGRYKRYRYLDYLIVEERVLSTKPVLEDGMLEKPGGWELVTHPSWERVYDAQRASLAAVQSAPNARAANLIAKVIAGSLVKTVAPRVFKKCRRPNKAAHRAIAQARAAVEIAVQDQPTTDLTAQNDNQPDQEIQLRPIVKIRRSDSREGGQASGAR